MLRLGRVARLVLRREPVEEHDDEARHELGRRRRLERRRDELGALAAAPAPARSAVSAPGNARGPEVGAVAALPVALVARRDLALRPVVLVAHPVGFLRESRRDRRRPGALLVAQRLEGRAAGGGADEVGRRLPDLEVGLGVEHGESGGAAQAVTARRTCASPLSSQFHGMTASSQRRLRIRRVVAQADPQFRRRRWNHRLSPSPASAPPSPPASHGRCVARRPAPRRRPDARRITATRCCRRPRVDLGRLHIRDGERRGGADARRHCRDSRRVAGARRRAGRCRRR